MDIKLIFSINRETFYLRIDKDKRVFYKDRKWKDEWQFIPKDAEMSRRVIMSRNKIPMFVLEWINEANSGKSLEEYNNAKTPEDLIPILKKDAVSKGCMFMKQEVTDG